MGVEWGEVQGSFCWASGVTSSETLMTVPRVGWVMMRLARSLLSLSSWSMSKSCLSSVLRPWKSMSAASKNSKSAETVSVGSSIEEGEESRGSLRLDMVMVPSEVEDPAVPVGV